MYVVFIPMATALAVGAAIFLALNAARHFWKQHLRQAWFHIIHPLTWIPFVPVSPLTRLVTSQSRIRRLAGNAQLRTVFSPAAVLRYKEVSGWLALASAYWFWRTVSLPQAMAASALLFGLAWQWPELYLAGRAARMCNRAQKELSQCVEMLRLFVTAGHNLDQAVRGAARELTGFWGHALQAVVYRLDLGVGFEDALTGAVAAKISDWDQVLLALKQAQFLGVSISGTLKVQSDLLRMRRKQKAEEQARSASVKIALPLVLCIFPALLIIYLAPAVLKIMSGL